MKYFSLVALVLSFGLLTGCVSERSYSFNPVTKEVKASIKGTDAELGKLQFYMEDANGNKTRLNVENLTQTDRAIEATTEALKLSNTVVGKIPTR